MNSNYCILDINKFQIINNPDYLIVSTSIAEIIKILIKKGYEIIRFDPASLEKLQVFTIFDLDENTKLNEKVLKNICYTSILIQFSEQCKFDIIPKKFYKMKEVNAFICTINFYDENPFRIKEYDELDMEINKIYSELKKWVINLPEVDNSTH